MTPRCDIAKTVGVSTLVLSQVLLSGQSPAAQEISSPVPFVGCKSDGQTGPVDAPAGKDKMVPIAAPRAARLAYYKAEQGPGVLAPRGWNCFGTYGSNGEALYLTPQPTDSAQLLSQNWKGFAGPAIEISHIFGDTSGRFVVARVIARLFPAHRAFLKGVIDANNPAGDFPVGPFATDHMTYRSQELVEYSTPAGSEGEGTKYRMLKDNEPIRGAAILVGDTPDLIVVNIRLAPDSSHLAAAILAQAESEATHLDR